MFLLNQLIHAQAMLVGPEALLFTGLSGKISVRFS